MTRLLSPLRTLLLVAVLTQPIIAEIGGSTASNVYEVTGGQKTAASIAKVDYVALARSVGFHSTFGFDDESSWRDQGPAVLSAIGPRFVSLWVEHALPDDLATPATPMPEQLKRMSNAIQNLL